jgi:broad specificity phosphatase PhoE
MGRAQVLALREQLNGVHISAIYSSDLLRAQQTAKLTAEYLDLPVTLEPRLREMDLGDWEGMLSDEIKDQFSRELAARARDPLNTRAPHGESPRHVATRVIAAVDEIGRRHLGESVLIVAHGISLAVIQCFAHGIPLDKVYEYIPGNAKLCHVEWKSPLHAGALIHPEHFWTHSVLITGEA